MPELSNEDPRDPRAPRNAQTDYGNSHRQREQQTRQTATEDKKIEKVVTHKVEVRKQGVGQRTRHWLSLLDFGSVARWIYNEVLLPEAKTTLHRAVSEGSEKLIFKNETIRRRDLGPGPSTSHVTTYNRRINRSMPPDPRTRAIEARSQVVARGPSRNNYVVSSKEESDAVLEHLYNNLDQYDMVSVGDLRQMLGLETEYTDFKFGWYELGRVDVRQIPEGWLIILPPPEHL